VVKLTDRYAEWRALKKLEYIDELMGAASGQDRRRPDMTDLIARTY
jgi:hypothetical protein